MNVWQIEIRTADGVAPAHLVEPDIRGPRPAVVFYMDAIGIRPALVDMASRLAAGGYVVLLPDLFYRAGPYPPVDAKAVFGNEAERAKLMARYRGLTQDMVRQDTAAYLDCLAALPDMSGKVGCVGYCMGGGCTVTAAGGHPDRVAAAASFHGGALATDKPDSPHRLAAQIKARIYVGVAGIDPMFSGEEEGRLAAAFRDGGVDHVIETYAGVRHGFAVDDHMVYDKTAAERHWVRVFGLFGETLH